MINLGYYNGKFGLLEEMSVPMTDRGCYFGDGVYDATTCANHIPFALDEHIDRFYNSAKLLKIEIPMERGELSSLLCELIKKVDSPEQLCYWQVTRGAAPRTHDFPDEVKANMWVMITPFSLKDLSHKEKLMTKDDTRFLHCNIKTLNLIPNIIASQEAREKGCYEVVFHRGGRVTECTKSNVSILKDGQLKTAPADNLILPGISRAHLINMCKAQGIPVDETAFTLDELFAADEVIVTSSSTLCQDVYEIDGKPVGGKDPGTVEKLKKALLEEYHKATSPAKA